MSYTPSIEDIAYLAESQPDKFSSPVQTLRSLGRALKHGNDTIGREVQATTVQAHYRHYLERGGQPLTESPIPAEPLDTGSRQDPILGSACVECASQTPCIALPKVIPGSSCRSHEELSFFSHALFINHGGKGNGPGHRVSIWRSMGAKRHVIGG